MSQRQIWACYRRMKSVVPSHPRAIVIVAFVACMFGGSSTSLAACGDYVLTTNQAHGMAAHNEADWSFEGAAGQPKRNWPSDRPVCHGPKCRHDLPLPAVPAPVAPRTLTDACAVRGQMIWLEYPLSGAISLDRSPRTSSGHRFEIEHPPRATARPSV